MNPTLPGGVPPAELLQDLLSTTSSVFWAASADKRELLFLNPAAEQVYGRSMAELFANPEIWLEAIHFEDREGVAQAGRRGLETGSFDVTYRILRPDGTERWVHDRGWLIGHGRRPRYWCGIALDITERRQTEQALQQTRERLELALTWRELGMWDYYLTEERVTLNPGWTDLLGYGPQTGRTFTWSQLLHPEEAEMVLGWLRGLVTGQIHICECEHRMRSNGQDWMWVLCRGKVVERTPAGEPLRVAGTFLDITARKIAEKNLLREKNIADRTISSLPGVFYLFDRQGRVLRWNRNLERVSGYASEEILRMHPFDFIAPKDRKRAEHGIDEAFRQGQATLEADVITKEGKRIPYLFTAVTFVLDQIECVVGMGIDLSARKRAERQIQSLNSQLERRVQARTSELEAANRELEAFAYSVSHDLRAPLRSIEGFGQAIEEECGAVLPQTGRANLERVRAAARRMGHLIESLLRLSKVGRSEINRVRVNLSQLAQSIANDFQASEPGRSVEFTIQPGLLAVADAYSLRIVLENLLGNAWKFTRKRERARVEFGRIQSPEGPAFFVRDNGAGFNMTYAGKLFVPFQRLHPADEYEGTGIGLATVRRIINRHGGHLWVEAEVDQGATFFFTLPFEQAEAHPDEPSNPQA